MCTNCNDIFNLKHKTKKCSCGKTEGQYIDNLNAIYSGPAFPIGFNNSSFIKAYHRQNSMNTKKRNSKNASGGGEEFIAFIIPEWADTLKKINTF